MRFRAAILLAVFVVICLAETQARIRRMEVEAVPLARVLANHEQRLKRNTNDLELLYRIARLHAMAYSTNLETVNVASNNPSGDLMVVESYNWSLRGDVPATVIVPTNSQARAVAKEHLTNAITYYERAEALIRQTHYKHWLSVPVHIGLGWSLEQAHRRAEAIYTYRRGLQVAWHNEVDPSWPLENLLNEPWDQIRAARKSATNSTSVRTFGGSGFRSREIMEYLTPLLDPVKDGNEIAQLIRDLDTLPDSGMSRWMSPILIPLEPDAPLEMLVNPDASVAFDLDGSGLQRHWGWITPRAAWLVYDHDGKGQITSGLQLFGNVTFWIFWRDGYEALSSLDDNGDGRITGNELRGLALWQDKNGNGICDPGEVRPLADYGITALECTSQTHESGIQFHLQGVTFKDGSTRATYDWIAPSHPDGVRTPEVKP